MAVELVLALDSSASMDKREFELQIKGLALAFRDPGVLQALANLAPEGVAIAVTQWGGSGEARVVIPFAHIRSARDAKAFGFRIGRLRRAFHATTTSIASAISDGGAVLSENDFRGARRVIDISGDGIDNGGLDLLAARDEALAQGVTVNGLAIEAEDATLSDYYRDNVIVGADSFVERANGFEDYARAIREKLVRELRPLES